MLKVIFHYWQYLLVGMILHSLSLIVITLTDWTTINPGQQVLFIIIFLAIILIKFLMKGELNLVYVGFVIQAGVLVLSMEIFHLEILSIGHMLWVMALVLIVVLSVDSVDEL